MSFNLILSSRIPQPSSSIGKGFGSFSSTRKGLNHPLPGSTKKNLLLLAWFVSNPTSELSDHRLGLPLHLCGLFIDWRLSTKRLMFKLDCRARLPLQSGLFSSKTNFNLDTNHFWFAILGPKLVRFSDPKLDQYPSRPDLLYARRSVKGYLVILSPFQVRFELSLK